MSRKVSQMSRVVAFFLTAPLPEAKQALEVIRTLVLTREHEGTITVGRSDSARPSLRRPKVAATKSDAETTEPAA